MPEDSKYRVLILGDFYYGETYARSGAAILREKGYAHSTAHLQPFIEACDTVIANLETPLVEDGGPVDAEAPRSSLHRAGPATGRALAKLGVDAVNLANDHTLDSGKEGLRSTLKILASHGIAAFGAGRNRPQAERPYCIRLPDNLGGGEIAVYGLLQPARTQKRRQQFATRWSAGSAQGSKYSVVVPIEYQAQPDTFNLAFPHWGSAYSWRSTQQKEIAEQLTASGYDLVIGHGSHALQEIGHSNNTIVVYGIGNGNLQVSTQWERHEEKHGVIPFSFWTILEVTKNAYSRRITAKLYPVEGNNRVTGFQPRPVDHDGFDNVMQSLAKRTGPDHTTAWKLLAVAEDDLGQHIRIEIADWPVGKPPESTLASGDESVEPNEHECLDVAPPSDSSSPAQNTYDDPASLEIIRENQDLRRHLGGLTISRAAMRQGATIEWLSTWNAWAIFDDRRIPISGHLGSESRLASHIVEDKLLSKRLLEAKGVSVPGGRQVHSPDDAISAQAEIGQPVVLKPSNGAMGRGVTVNLENSRDISDAFQRARSAGRRVLVEQYIRGTEYRAHATSTECVGVFRRLLPSVTGDGNSTIAALIYEKNESRKGNPTTRDFPIPMDDVAEGFLQRRGLSLDSIVPAGERVIVRDVNGLTSGGDSEECFESAPESLKQTAIDAVAAIPGMDWGGVDILVEDGTGIPYVMEVNTDASINGSTFPVYGRPRDVGGALWNRVYAASEPDQTGDIRALAPTSTAMQISSLAPTTTSSVSLAALLRSNLRERGRKISQHTRLIWSAHSDGKATLWFSDTVNAKDLALGLFPLRRRRYMRTILRRMRVPQPTGLTVKSAGQLRAFLEKVGTEVALLPTRGQTRGTGPIVIGPNDSIHQRLFAQRTDGWFAQTYRPGLRFRIVATSTEALAAVAPSGQAIPSAPVLARASQVAVQAIRAVPLLRWATVDLRIRDDAEQCLVEDMSFRPTFSTDAQVIAGSMDSVFEMLADGAAVLLTEVDKPRTRASATEAQQVVHEGLTYTLTEESARLVDARNASADLVVPATVSNRPVTSVAMGAFKGNHELRSLSLPDSVETLGANALNGCTALEWVELPPKLEVINARAFEGCTSLRTVRLPRKLRRIGTRAFADCNALLELPHPTSWGSGAVGADDRDLVEYFLPTDLEYIGEAAFLNCSELQSITIPYKVRRLRASTFEGCTSLQEAWLHAHLSRIDERVFADCTSLKQLSVPDSVTTLAPDALPNQVTLIVSAGTAAHRHARKAKLSVRSRSLPEHPIVSGLGVDSELNVADVLDDPDLLRSVLDAYEVRPPMSEVGRRPVDANSTPVRPSRFRWADGRYQSDDGPATYGDGDVTIMMVGDLMCGWRQQRSASNETGYDFTASFARIKPVLAQADLAIGNLESMFSPSYPYMSEKLFADDRPNLNAPFAYLAALREAGFDAVLSAQNHMYDTGIKGILETLESLNRAQLVHGGLFADPREPRHLLLTIKGITIGVVAYLDPARQRIKQANFTAAGLAATASPFDSERITADITAARSAGAEYILAYAHWGREHTEMITTRQEQFAQMLADAGADYIFGAHPHWPQHYTVLKSHDDRPVPVVYSGGNFLSDIQLHLPTTQDSFIAALTLTRDDSGSVVRKHDGYLPCRIVQSPEIRGFVATVPTHELEAGSRDYDRLDAAEDRRRLANIMGDRYRVLDHRRMRSPATLQDTRPAVNVDSDGLVDQYSLREPQFAVQLPSTGARPTKPPFRFDEASGRWRREHETVQGEAVIMCAGAVLYDQHLEQRAHLDDTYQFRPMFKQVRAALATSDLALASFGSLVADMYPTTGAVTPAVAGGAYGNARPEFLDGMRYAGFDCLAMAHPGNLDTGVRGLLATEEAVRRQGLVPSGIGRHKLPLIELNGIVVGVVSYTMDVNRRSMITPDGAGRLLNVFDQRRVQQAVADVRRAGAQFVLAYLDCRSTDGTYRLAERREAATLLAEAGVDYVVCTLPAVLTRYLRHETTDGRSVPIATSLGTLASGHVRPTNSVTALLRIALRRVDDHTIEVDDSYIPLQRVDPGHTLLPLVAPAHTEYLRKADDDWCQEVHKEVADRLGQLVQIDKTRTTSISSPFVRNLSPADASRILGVSFGPDELAVLGEQFTEAVPGIVTRQRDLRPGCIAVIVEHEGDRRDRDRITARGAVTRGAIAVVSEVHHDAVPTLVVPHAWEAYAKLMSAIRETYDPLTVAITGTAGKTTTKGLMAAVFERHFRTLHIEGNYNTLATVPLVLQKLTASDRAYVQEINGGWPGSARALSRLVRPDIAVITAIGDGHLDHMGSVENVTAGKMQIVDGLTAGGVLVINNDSEHLKRQTPDVRTIRYGIGDPACDYYAQNIRTTRRNVQFQVVCAEGVFDTVINLHGLHNVSNALAVFAAARHAGIPAQTIIAGLARYHPSSNRQNIIEVGGYLVFLDAYNSNVISLTAALEAHCSLSLEDGARRYVIMGDMGEQGEKAQENHKLMGRRIAEMPIAGLFCIGENARHTAASAQEAGMRAAHFYRTVDLVHAVRDEIRPGDAVLFKAAGAANLTETVVYPLFGKIG